MRLVAAFLAVEVHGRIAAAVCGRLRRLVFALETLLSRPGFDHLLFLGRKDPPSAFYGRQFESRYFLRFTGHRPLLPSTERESEAVAAYRSAVEKVIRLTDG